MKTLFALLALAFVAAADCVLGTKEEAVYESVALADLIATPADFHGKLISITTPICLSCQKC